MKKPFICRRCGTNENRNSIQSPLCRGCWVICPHCDKQNKYINKSGRYFSLCFGCMTALGKKHRADINYRNKQLISKKYRHQADPRKRLVVDARGRARRAGLSFNLEISDLVIPGMCPVLGIPIFVGSRRSKTNSPSLDRIAPELGYVKGNVNVISNRANWLRNNATAEELRLVYEYAKGLL